MGKLTIVDEDGVATSDPSLAVVQPPASKKIRMTNASCGGLVMKGNMKTYQQISEAQEKTSKKQQSMYKRAHRQRAQHHYQSSRKTKGISDESGYFEDIEDDGNDAATCNTAILGNPNHVVTNDAPTAAQGTFTTLLEKCSNSRKKDENIGTDARDSIEIIYDRNADVYENNRTGEVGHHYSSTKTQQITNHLQMSSLIKQDLLKQPVTVCSNVRINKNSEKFPDNNKVVVHHAFSSLSPSTTLPLTTSSTAIVTSTSSSIIPTTTASKSDKELTGKLENHIIFGKNKVINGNKP